MARLHEKILLPSKFLPFIRTIEEIAIAIGDPGALIYWSSHKAARLLPKGTRLRDLMRDAALVSIFSEDDENVIDEFAFFLVGPSGSFLISGLLLTDESEEGFLPPGSYIVRPSANPYFVGVQLAELFPRFESLDPPELERLKLCLDRFELGPLPGEALVEISWAWNNL
ncbi:MAG: hypothetical protein KC777_20725 [Cyanobacteria bacterium HKST-UBA02]|nr:hypothetical protein [Cyanobacteria bacterium HKST-UBA02]